MKREYDFSSAVRGKLFRKGAELNFPIYVDGPMHKRLERLTKRKGKSVTDLVNQLFKRELELPVNLHELQATKPRAGETHPIWRPLPLNRTLIHITDHRGSSR